MKEEKEETFSQKNLEKIFYDYTPKDPTKIFIFNIITLGFYSVFWVKKTNKFLDKIDPNSPNPNLTKIILLYVPGFWLILFTLLEYFIDLIKPIYILNLKVLSISLISFLSLNYIYLFCKSFGKTTNTSGLIWYIFFYCSYLSGILFLFKFYYLIALYLFLIITPPGMQAALNAQEREILRKREAKIFNYHTNETNDKK